MALTTLHATIPTSIATRSQSSHVKSSHMPSSLPCQNPSVDLKRRNLISLAITGVVVGLNMGEKNAWAGARRPPPQPQEEKEKKDPNINGVLAKVLASKKRKEAMKQAVAEQRARGKQIQVQVQVQVEDK